jgi:hypothetical protein
MHQKSFKGLAAGVISIKRLWSTFTHYLGKLDHFSAMIKIMYSNETV